jgi:hypothetical protein
VFRAYASHDVYQNAGSWEVFGNTLILRKAMISMSSVGGPGNPRERLDYHLDPTYSVDGRIIISVNPDGEEHYEKVK